MKKKLILSICIALVSITTYAQVDRSPAGEKSGKEHGGGASEKKGKETNAKGKVSQSAKDVSKQIKDANSVDGKGKVMTETQRNEAARQLGNEASKAAIENRRADKEYFEKEKEKLNNK